MALCLGSFEQIRSSKERGFDPRPPQPFFCYEPFACGFLEGLVPVSRSASTEYLHSPAPG